MDQITLTKENIKDLLKQSEKDPAYFMVNLYKFVFPDWDNISRVNGFPKISTNTSLYIMDEFTKYSNDVSNNSLVQFGLLWLNSGFSSDDLMKDFEVDLSNVELIYNTN